MIQIISSRQNEKIKELVKLFQPSTRLEKKEFLLEGEHLFEMALECGLLKEVYTLKEIKSLPQDIDQYIITEEILAKITKSKSPQGIVSVCKMKEPKEIKSNQVLYLDDIQDPGNIGTLLRSALCFSYTDVILSSACASIYNEKVIQSSQGAIFKLNIIENGEKVLKKLSKEGYFLLATSLHDAKDIYDIDVPQKHVLVLGNEARGVNSELLKIADERLYIPIEGIDSLNVAVAGGIAMYELSRRMK